MTNAWLQQQRKGALTEIADHVGLKKCAPTIKELPQTPSILSLFKPADTHEPQQRRALQKDRPRSRTGRVPTRQQLQAVLGFQSRTLLLHRRPFVAREAGSPDRHSAGEEAEGPATNHQST